jgi:hypothetical protein
MKSECLASREKRSGYGGGQHQEKSRSIDVEQVKARYSSPLGDL